MSTFRASVSSLLLLLLPACSFYEVSDGPRDGGTSPDGARGDSAPDAPAAFDRCAFSGAEDPLRYAGVTSATGAMLSWQDARTACVQRGMDLAVMNTAEEIGAVDLDLAQWPMWVGETQASAGAPWVAVDGCPAVAPTDGSVTGVVRNPLLGAGSACSVFADANSLAANTCDGSLPGDPDGAVVTQALCETPRPESASCRRDPSKETYVVSQAPLAHDAAIAFCTTQHAHLVVIDSNAELSLVSGLIGTRVAADFWVGETWTGQEWKSETSCPGEFAWADGGAQTATLGATTMCTSAVISDGSDAEVPGAELVGQELTACDGAKLALCESDPA